MKNEKPEIIVKHDNVEIGYYESDNTWKFVLRGRSRTVESLTKAKEAIDKPVPAKEEPFQRMSAFMFDRWGIEEIKKVTVTSIAERSNSHSYSDAVWVVEDKSGNRSKEGIHSIFLPTADNLEKVKRFKAIGKEIDVLNKEKETIIKAMERIKLPKDAEAV